MRVSAGESRATVVEWAHGNGERMKPEAARTPRVGLVVVSTRPVRVGGQLGVQLAKLIEEDHLGIEVVIIDLRALALPFLDEPRMASLGVYVHDHTLRWAATIDGLDAIVFLTPQYNWGYPAPLKNAIDYLFAEWRGLPGLLVTYGTHGGTKCYDQITQVLDRVGVDLVKPGICVYVPKDAYGPDDHLIDPGAVLAPDGAQVRDRLTELVAKAQVRASARDSAPSEE